jgi:ParB/RepB/Spo0J family partition protein
MATHLTLDLSHLKTHPKNMRRFYPESDVREMGESILAHGGVLEDLLIVPDGDEDYYVVAGNLRLAGGRWLGDRCPPLDCKIITKNKAEQLLVMLTENVIRHDVDPVSEARHYQRLIEEGLSVRDISKGTGIYEMRIRSRLRITELDERIQDHMAKGEFPHGVPVCDAFLSIPNKKLRIQLADRLAANPNTNTKTILRACEGLLKRLSAKDVPAMKVPSVQLTGAGRPRGSVSAQELRAAASRTCKACDLSEAYLKDAKEPAWSVVTHAAGEVCGSCNMINAQDSCKDCPLVEMLRALVPAGKK